MGGRTPTIDTIPEPTLLAFGEHGAVCDLFEPDAEAAAKVIEHSPVDE